MTVIAEKFNLTVDESALKIISRAENSRGLNAPDIRERVAKSIEKYVLRDNENAGNVEIKEFVEGIRADDLCLIIACENGDETAWSALVKTFDATVKSAARKVSNNAEDAEDLASSIWAELYGLKRDASGKLKTKLSYYSGRGSLAGWLRAVVSQLAIDQFRKESKFVQIEEDREFENLVNESSEKTGHASIVSRSKNPENLFGDAEAQKDVSRALKQAIGELAAEDKLILKLYYFDELKLKDIGGALGFHEATASRKLARVQTEIRKMVEQILSAEYGWKPEEVTRHLSETAGRLGISIEKLFAAALFLAFVQEII